MSLTPFGLELPADLPYAEWEAMAEPLGFLVKVSTWAIGDWLNYGEDHYGESYSQAERYTGLEPQTLYNYKYVASRFPKERRQIALSFTHHAEVASLPAPVADKLLTVAAPMPGETVPALSTREVRQEARKVRRVLIEQEDPIHAFLDLMAEKITDIARRLPFDQEPGTRLDELLFLIEDTRKHLDREGRL